MECSVARTTTLDRECTSVRKNDLIRWWPLLGGLLNSILLSQCIWNLAIKTGGLWLEGHYKREITVPIKPLSCKLKQMLPIKNMFVSRLVIRVSVLKLNATFNNISVTSWRSVLLVEETGVPRENHRPTASHWQTLSHNAVSSTTSHWAGFELTSLVVIGADCTNSCKSNYHTITTTKASDLLLSLCNILKLLMSMPLDLYNTRWRI